MKKLIYLFAAMLVLTACPGVTPEVPEYTLDVTPSELSFTSPDEASLPLTIKSNANWTISVSNGASWCQPSAFSGKGDATIQVKVTANTVTSPRSASISVSASGGLNKSVSVSQAAGKESPSQTETITLEASPKAWDGQKRADITYQLLVYSFADGRGGDRWGDLKGVTDHLDYLNDLGVSALWLSPIQPATSYHGYNVNDYFAIDSHLGTEDDFKTLIAGAGAKGIDIYMDYVLNHSGKGNKWFTEATSTVGSSYRSWYVISDDPASDVAAGKIDNYAGASGPGMGTWHKIGIGAGYKGRLHFKLDWSGSTKTVTVTTSDAAPRSSNPSASKWLWIGEVGAVGLYETSSNIFEITLEVDTDWGFLVRSASGNDWSVGTKWGTPSGGKAIVFGTPFTLAANSASFDPGNIVFSNESTNYFASFDSGMPDLNYGPYSTASTHPCFKALAESADKWINMGVNGLRLDAVIWIYQNQTEANVSFLKQWYDRCNATYKARGGKGELYMVGEAWCDNATQAASYYKGLPSNFNFWYWYTLKDRINNKKGNDFASTIIGFREQFKANRSDFIDAIKLSNHDEDRAGNDLGRSADKEKLAAAVLLTSPGKPYIYQGEELGYWGNKGGGDEYVRTPIKWTKTGTVADAALDGKIDNSMLSESISVEAQQADAASILNVYKTFARLRNSYASLASGEMSAHPVFNSNNSRYAAIGAWYRTLGSEKTLVVHNFSNNKISASFGTEDLSRVIGLCGGGFLKTTKTGGVVTDNTLTLNGYSSVVFLIQE